MKILIIGDSHVDTTDAYLQNPKTSTCFGELLAERLTKAGHEVSLAGVGGSKVKDWLKNKVSRKGKEVDTTTLPKADLLIVSLGSNDMGKGGDAAAVVADFPKLVAKFTPTSFTWVGPPQMRTGTKYNNENMAKLYNAAAAAGIPIFDSRVPTAGLVDSGEGDGVHSGPQAAKAWADAVAMAVGSAAPAQVAPPPTPTKAAVSPMLAVVVAVAIAVLVARSKK